METLFLLTALTSFAACAFMTGLVVFVEWVHYPGFRFANPETGGKFHSFHSRRTGYIVGFPMLTELVSAFAMLYFAWQLGSTYLIFSSAVSALLVCAIWADTAIRVIPAHGGVQQTGMKDLAAVDRLVKSNRLRTFLWLFRFLLLFLMITFLSLKRFQS
ncbi:MAG: hypothetical protein LAT67_15355 [Balneolales bacterium]|nr:hypothetical protein [Balneolales bacterium]